MCPTEPMLFSEVLWRGKNRQVNFHIVNLIPIRERKTIKALPVFIFKIHEINCILKMFPKAICVLEEGFPSLFTYSIESRRKTTTKPSLDQQMLGCHLSLLLKLCFFYYISFAYGDIKVSCRIPHSVLDTIFEHHWQMGPSSFVSPSCL